MAKQEKSGGTLLIALGVLAILFLIDLDQISAPREAIPSFDGFISDFEVEIEDAAPRAEEGDTYWVDLRVTNNENRDAQMWVQCSILDRAVEDWIGRATFSRTSFTIEDNCVGNEPHTQTALVSLDEEEDELIRFSFLVPEAGSDDVIYCGAFERCYAENRDSLTSSEAVRSITIEEEDDDDTNTVEGDACIRERDCPGWIFGEVACVNGMCVDEENTPIDWEVPTDEAVKDYASEHKAAIFFIAFLIVIIGWWIAFQEPKLPRL